MSGTQNLTSISSDFFKLRFLWVTFQIDSICRENTDAGILNALEDLPKDLPTTYRRILRQLRDLGSTDPHMGKKVFELITAARRPLTLEELREAISIPPGNTTWSAAKLVNDVMKSLSCCGSLVVVDEELSTVHFAHSSVKQHLETRPGNLDIPEYHIEPFSASLSMGQIIVTYLNLDVLQGQLTNASKSPSTSATQDASFLLRASLPHSTRSSSLARKLLKNRKMTGYDVGRDLEKVAGFTRNSKVQPQHANSFLSYAQEQWLFHCQAISFSNDWKWFRLLARLIDGDIRTVELPWTSEDARAMSPHFLDCISHHPTLVLFVYEKLWNQGNEGVYGMRKLFDALSIGVDGDQYYGENLMDRVANNHAREFTQNLMDAVANNSVNAFRLLLDTKSADVNNIAGKVLDTALHIAAMRGEFGIVKMLLDHGADVDTLNVRYRYMMETAARFSSEQGNPLLVEGTAEAFLSDDLYSSEMKHLLRISYNRHRKIRRDDEGGKTSKGLLLRVLIGP